MRCIKCNKNITDLSTALDDGMGGAVRLHRACAVEVTPGDLDASGYEEVGASVVMPPLPDYITKPGAPYPTGTAVDIDRLRPLPASQPAKKAASEQEPVSLGQCAICHRGIQAGEDVVRYRGYAGHNRACLQALAELMREPETVQTAMSKSLGSRMTREANGREEDHRRARAAAEYEHRRIHAVYGDQLREAGVISKHFTEAELIGE